MSIEAKTLALCGLGFSVWLAVVWLIARIMGGCRND